MKVVEILQIGRELLKMMSENDLRVNDYMFVGMYHEYEFLRGEHEKYNTIISRLSNKYRISQSKVKRIIRRFEKEVKK
jgi:hypothetical protein